MKVPVMSSVLESNCADAFSSSFSSLLLVFSGMFFDGNHTYTIEPGGQDNGHVSVLNTYINWETSSQMNPNWKQVFKPGSNDTRRPG